MNKMILLSAVLVVQGVIAERQQTVTDLIGYFEGLPETGTQVDQGYKTFEKDLLHRFKHEMEVVDASDRLKLFKAAAANQPLTILKFFEKLDPLSEEAFEVIAGKNEKGQTLLHIAVKNRHKDIFKVLLLILNIMQSNGIDISKILNAQTDEGKNTALHYAIGAVKGKKNWHFMLPLLEMGADLNIENAQGKTPIDRARDNIVLNPGLAGFLEWYDLKKKAQSV